MKKTHAGRKHLWRTSTALPYIVTALMLYLMSACQRNPQTESNMQASAHLDSLARTYLSGRFDNPEETTRRLERLENQQKDTASRFHVELYKAVVLNEMNKKRECNEIRNKVLQWCKAHPEHNYLSGMVWNHLGVELVGAGKIHESCKYFEKACHMLDGRIVNQSLINAYINAANANLHIGRPVTAVQHYRRAIFLADSLNLDDIKPAIYCGLGQVYSMLENYPEARSCLNMAELRIHQQPPMERGFYFMTRGNCCFFEKKYEQALTMFDSAHVCAKATGDEINMVRSECNMGETLLCMGRTEQARPYLQRSLNYVRKHPDAPASLRFYTLSMATELALVDNRLNDAEQLLKHEVDTTGVDEPRFIALHFYRLQRYYEKRGNWREAYLMQKLGHHYDDSLKSKQTANNIIEIRSRYEQDATLLQQKNTIMRYEARTSRQQLIITGVSLGLVTIALAALAIIILLRRRAEQRHQAQVQQMGRLRMSLVQNRMQPHYIFNVLGTLLPKLNSYPELSNDISLLIDVLRGNLLIADKTAIPLANERQLVERFVKLHHITNGAYPTLTWHEEGMPPHDMMVPAMCLQIPVENALKHAFSPITPESRIEVYIKFSDDMLSLRIVDNGRGYNPGLIPQTGRDTGTGIRVLSRTIHLLNARNSRQASLFIGNRTDGQHGTEVKLNIPRDYQWEM